MTTDFRTNTTGNGVINLNLDTTNDPSYERPAGDRWLVIYRYYLIAAVALSVIGLAKLIFNSFDNFMPLIFNIAQIGLFVFAINSLNRIGEKWVRTLHLSINGVAVVMGMFYYLENVFGYSQVWSLWYTSIVLQIGGVAVFPIGQLVPWRFLWLHFAEQWRGSGQPPVILMIRMAITTFAFAPAVFWSIRWTKERNASTTNEATETEAAKVAASWIIYLILTAVMAGFVGVILHGGIGGALTTFNFGNLADIIITLILVYIPAQIILTYWLCRRLKVHGAASLLCLFPMALVVSMILDA